MERKRVVSIPKNKSYMVHNQRTHSKIYLKEEKDVLIPKVYDSMQ